MAKGKGIDLKALAAKAAQLQDQTKTKEGGGDFAPPAEGTTVGRFVDYIEVGVHKQKPFRGKAKPPAAKVYLTFELLGSKNLKEIEVNGQKKQVADRITFPLTLSLHERAGFKKLFDKMLYGREGITHMTQMLGEAFKITVIHNVVDKDGTKRTYANITDKDGNYLVGPAVKREEDDEGNVVSTKKLKVPDALSTVRAFVWDMPTKEMWDSIFIDGEREVKEGDKVKTVSKNWIQNMILSAENFADSPVEAFLEGSGELPDDPEELEDEEEVEDDEETEEDAEEETEDEADEEEAEDEEEVEDSDEEVEEDEEEEEAPPPKKSVSKVAAKGKAPAKAATEKKSASAPVKASSTKTVKTGAKSATKSPSKMKAKGKSKDADDALAELGLLG